MLIELALNRFAQRLRRAHYVREIDVFDMLTAFTRSSPLTPRLAYARDAYDHSLRSAHCVREIDALVVLTVFTIIVFILFLTTFTIIAFVRS